MSDVDPALADPALADPALADTAVSSADDDWATKAAATAVGYVDTVREATTGKALVASRAVVYFAAAGLIAIVLLVLALILLVRGTVTLTAYLPFVGDGETWFAYLVLGVVFLAIGLFLWRKKEPAADQ